MAFWDKKDGLTEKQAEFIERFCAIYAKTGKEDWRKAALEAGYAKGALSSQVKYLKENEEIQKRIQGRLKEAAKACNITVEFVIQQFLEIYNRAMEITPVRNSHGKFLGHFKFDGRTANRAMELIAKVSGMYTDTVVHKNEDFDEAMQKIFQKAKEEAQEKGAKYSPERDPEILSKAVKLTESKIVRVREEETYDGIAEKEVPTIFNSDPEDLSDCPEEDNYDEEDRGDNDDLAG